MDDAVERSVESSVESSVEVDVGAVPPELPHARRSRVVTGVVAAMLVAGSGGLGFGLGRSLTGDEATPLAAPPTSEAGTVAPASTLPAAEAVPTTAAAAADADDAVEVPTSVAPSGGEVTAEIMAAPYGGTLALDLVWEGTTDDGLRLRLLVGAIPGEIGEVDFNGWRPAAFCYGGGQMRLSIDGPDLVDVAFGQWYTEMYGSVETAFVGDVGVADGNPMRLVVVQATDDVVEVTARFDDGVTVTAPVEAGAAVLLTPGAEAWAHPFDLDITLADGSTETVPGGFQPRDADPAWRDACMPPPPTLPDAGEQPADPDAERVAIEERFTLLWDQSIDRADKPVLLDDDTGIDDAVALVFEGGFAATAQTAVHTIDELVFTAPDRAWFRYSIQTDMTFFGDRFGVAKLTADGWIFPRALMCQDLMLASPGCDPPAEVIYPPSWYEANGTQCTYDPNGEESTCVGWEDSEIATW